MRIERKKRINIPLLLLPLLRSTQITIIAMIITSKAATTGTTRFKLERMIRIVSSAVNSGISRVGAIVPETTNQKERKSEEGILFVSRFGCLNFFFGGVALDAFNFDFHYNKQFIEFA